MSHNLSDIEIAQKASYQPITEIGSKLGIPSEALLPYGHTKAKISYDYIQKQQGNKNGKLILVTAISPTPAGEGKTTTTVGLGDGLSRIGKKTAICLREPSLGPCFGVKGGAAGGGYAQVIPMEDINLHFTGDFHAIGAAHNLLSAMTDNHMYWGNSLDLDSRRVGWRRVIDMNDRSLRDIAIGLGGPGNGFARQTGFDITVASEIMAIFCLATDLKDLQRRLSNIVIGQTRDRQPVTAKEVNADGAMTALLKDAILPNLVQTLEGTPAFIHGGPFANIAHGCNSVMATTAALKMADYVVTEAGFGADLGAEKFMDIKCRKTGLAPDAVVIVATVRALKMHGGVPKDQLKGENLDALKAGFANLERHLQNINKFGVPAVVAINKFSADTDAEHALLAQLCQANGAKVILCNHWAEGGKGTEELAHEIVDICENRPGNFQLLYDDKATLWDKVSTVAKEIYRAENVTADAAVRKQFDEYQERYGHFPVCMAKTQSSFSTDPTRMGAPVGHTVHVRELRLSAGAEFVVAVCGDIMIMPGLPKVPSAEKIYVNDNGQIEGLF
jgi:formate--tetrahydrofolate ligase